MSDCVLYVPVEGYLELFMDGSTGPDVLARLHHQAGAVWHLTKDGGQVATMSYDYTAVGFNGRAARVAHRLTGATFDVYGPVVFEHISEHVALAVMLEVTSAIKGA